MEWRPAGWSVCLPLLISPCTIKSTSSLLAPAHLGGPGEGAAKWLWWYVSPRLWNQLPSSLRQPHSSLPVSDSPVDALTTSSHSVNSPLSPSLSLSLPPYTPSSLRTDSTWTVSSEHLVFFVFFVSSLLSFVFLVPCGRLSWLFLSFWVHVNIAYPIARSCFYLCMVS